MQNANKLLKRLGIFLLALCAVSVRPVRAAESVHVIANFDEVAPETFAFKDEKGSILNASSAYLDEKKGKHLGVRYNIVTGGWGGWGMPLKGFNASRYRYLSFDLKGERGGEVFEIGLRDKAGQEKKFPVNRFMDTPREWQQVLIPLTEFMGVDLASLDNINLGFNDSHGGGRVFIDNFRFEGSPQPVGESLSVAPTLVNKSLVDGFERTSPFDVYQVFQGDESSLNLTSSRLVYDGDYSMEMEYRFSTTRPWGSWVSAIRNLRDPLDWTGVQEAKIWIKGDGSDNAFRFRITEADGEMWEFTDSDVLRFTRWTLVTMPMGRFELISPTRTNGQLDLGAIKAYQLDILSPTSVTSTGAKSGTGRIQVDQLYVSGERLRAAQSAPAGTVPQLRTAVTAIGNVDFSLFAYTEYFFTPEKKSEINQYAKLIANAKYSNYSARVEFGSKSQEFGAASAFIGSSVTSTENRSADAEIPSLQVMGNNISPYLTNITLGHVFVDYSPYTFSPVFGFKGLAAEGDYDRFNYHAFALKHPLNSFTAGTRVRGLWPNWKVTAYTVYWEQNAKLASPSAVSGGNLNQANSAVQELERVAQDLVYNLESEGRFLNGRLTLYGLYGYNEYKQTATADFSLPNNAFDPVFIAPLDQSLNPAGAIWRGKLETDGLLWRGLATSYGYRDVDAAYKPKYRQNPAFFDDTETDHWGHNFRIVQHYKGWVLSNEYDTIRRHSRREYFRHRYNWGLGHYGYKGLDVAFNQEYRREIYSATSDRSNFSTVRNEKVIASELYVRTQLSPRIAYWIKPRQERVWAPAQNTNFVADILHMKLEFYISTNARFFAEHKVLKYGHPDFEPQGHPFDDNFTRVTFEVTF